MSFLLALGSPPARHQERFEALLAATLGPHGVQRRPGGLRALIWCSPAPLREQFLRLFLMTFRICVFFRSVSSSSSSSLACSSSFSVFEGFEAFVSKVGNPRTLKPGVAAGGREAIRINEISGKSMKIMENWRN